MKLNITITREESGMRMDALLHARYPELSRSRAAALIKSGLITHEKGPKRPGYKVKTGDVLQGEVPAENGEESLPVAQAMDLEICHEDDQLLVVAKPPGLVVHPGAGNVDGTLVNGLLHHCPELAAACEDPLRPGIVHRLDKETSGLLVVAKTRSAFDFLKQEFMEHRVEKIYEALVWGSHLDGEGEIDLPIGRHPVKRKQMAVDRESGREARTQWTVLERYREACHVRVRLHTGRTHQIRVHFHAMGHPLVGDPVYQFRRFRKQARGGHRQMLHARRLAFRHPVSQQMLAFSTPPPADFSITQSKLAGR